MTKYICKCGRVVAKSTSADTTGNRDTENCKGCPYLLPWGPTQWDATRHAMVTDVKGYECRMSPSLDYASYYQGGGEDKCVLHIYSLDYDFLDQVTTWAAKQFPEKEISCSFDRSKIRAAEFVGGLYGMSVYPMQNKKGMAAKGALIERFFGPDKHRLDMTPEEEKAHILAAIEAGKAKAQKKEDKTLIYKDPVTGWLYRVGPNPINDKGVYELEYLDQQNSTIWKPDVYWNTNAVYRDQEHLQKALDDRAHRDAWEPVEDVPAANPTPAAHASPVDAGAATQSLSDAGPVSLAADECTENPTSSAAATAAAEETVAAPKPSDSASMMAVSAAKTNAEVVDATNKVAASSNLPDVCRDCQCATCGNEGCASHCWENPREVGDCEITGPAGDACRDYRPKEDVQCQKENAPSAAAAATSDGSAARMCEGPDEETQTTPVAASGAALESLHAQSALPQNAPAQDIAADAPSALGFDFGADVATNAELLQCAQTFVMGRVAQVMAAKKAHDITANHYQGSWGKWCQAVGISRDTGDNYVRVAENFGNIELNGKPIIEVTPISLLALGAKPSTPDVLTEGIGRGEITTIKQFRELEAKLKAEREAREKAEQDVEYFKKDSEDARKAAHTYHCKYDEANAQRNALLDEQGTYVSQITAAEQRVEDAERRAQAAEEDAAEKDKRIRELETGRPQTIEATVVERIRMPEMAEEDAAELTTNLAASVTTVQRSFFMAAAAMAPQVKARCANTLWDTVNELATLLAASANPSYEEEEATPFD